MQTQKQRAASRRNNKRNAEHMKRMRMIALARKNGPDIPDGVIKALAALRLPNDLRAYEESLNALLGTVLYQPRSGARGGS